MFTFPQDFDFSNSWWLTFTKTLTLPWRSRHVGTRSVVGRVPRSLGQSRDPNLKLRECPEDKERGRIYPQPTLWKRISVMKSSGRWDLFPLIT